MLFCDKKQQVRFVSLMGFEAHCLQMNPAFLLKGVQNCMLFAIKTPFCIPVVRGNTGSSCYVWLISCTVICIRSWGSGNLLTVCLTIGKVIQICSPFVIKPVTFDIKNYNRSLWQEFGFACIRYLNPIPVKTHHLGMLHTKI